MPVRPLHDRVLIKRIEEQETVEVGIIIPDTTKEKSQEGDVVAVGAGKTLENGSVAALEVKAGIGCSLENTPEPKSSLKIRTI